MTTCPAVSEYGRPCALSDARVPHHHKGHLSAYDTDRQVRDAWPTTRDDLIRWGAVFGIGVATDDRRLAGRVHALTGHRRPTAKRNRQRLWTACGIRLDQAWPFEVTPGQACRKCYPTTANG